jgi:hypothetical protein
MVFCPAIAGVLTPAQALTQQEFVAKLTAAGYPLIGDIKSAHEGKVAKATQDGKDVHLVVGSSGQIQKCD